MIHHRWIAASLFGRWCASSDEAHFDALRAGQATLRLALDDQVVLRDFVAIESSPNIRLF